MNELEKKIFGDLGAWIEKHISVKQAGADKDSKNINKADLLEHILERYRLQQKRLDNSISFEDAINWECYADEEQLVLSSPDKPAPTLSKGTGPYYLQLPLMFYLLSRQGKRESVYQIIEGFIKREWDYLLPEDFKKTRTGVYRYFTNTRFAAKALREEGLLKYGEGEAFKTWELSFMGVLVAAWLRRLIRTNPPQKEWRSDLNRAIATQKSSLLDFEHCVKLLWHYCITMTDNYPSYSWMLDLVGDYLTAYNEELSRRRESFYVKRDLTIDIMDRLEQTDGFEDFLDDFIEHLEIDRILSLHS